VPKLLSIYHCKHSCNPLRHYNFLKNVDALAVWKSAATLTNAIIIIIIYGKIRARVAYMRGNFLKKFTPSHRLSIFVIYQGQGSVEYCSNAKLFLNSVSIFFLNQDNSRLASCVVFITHSSRFQNHTLHCLQIMMTSHFNTYVLKTRS
jgi:hypothetical protein